MYGVQKQQLRDLTKQEFVALKMLTRLAKNMYNVGLYNIRQHYFTNKTFLYYKENNQASKNNENYKLLNTDVAQQILKKVEENFKSFFGLLKNPGQKARIPKYLEKDSYFELSFPRVKLQDDGTFFLPMSPAFKKQFGKIKIKFPTNLDIKKIAEIRIQPKYDANYFEIEYVYYVNKDKINLDYSKAIVLDFGINNLAACVTTDGASFLIDGKPLKSKNHWYNKQNAKLQSIKDVQKLTFLTKKQRRLLIYRNNFVNDYLNKATRYLVSYCIKHDIGTMIIGYNKHWKKEINIGGVNNQNFVQIPHGKFKDKLKSMCERYGIVFFEQEESYTSKASFVDGDILPVYKENDECIYTFSGNRKKRGLYQTKKGTLLNADSNGAANILRKSGFKFNENTLVFGLRKNPLKVELLKKKKVNTDSRERVHSGRLTVPMRRQPELSFA